MPREAPPFRAGVVHGKWFAHNPDGSFEELDLGEDSESIPVNDWGRNSVMYQWLGLANSHLPQVTPVKQTEVPEALKAHFYPEAPASGCVKLSDFESYPYASREWTGHTDSD